MEKFITFIYTDPNKIPGKKLVEIYDFDTNNDTAKQIAKALIPMSQEIPDIQTLIKHAPTPAPK